MLFDTRLIRDVDLTENNCRLYLITPESLDPVKFAAHLSQALDAGDVDVCSFGSKENPGADYPRH